MAWFRVEGLRASGLELSITRAKVPGCSTHVMSHLTSIPKP